ncbi:GPW/gp25 family protein [Portibacter marinus]|uniref:GPW/gp25 family protein n=1 Tax=Portibacter marinus TaxID=2898660 RepID=UPI001F21E70D|nr:GPW/gp25 family protein [Portibacter marinus]
MKNTFLGRGWTFPPTFVKEKNAVEMVEDEIDIEQSLKLILSTRPGERITNPKFGCNLYDYLFEPTIKSTLTKMKSAIETAILYFEPRITLNNVEIDTSRELEGILDIKLEYTIRKINVRSNIVFPFYKLEGTLIDEDNI